MVREYEESVLAQSTDSHICAFWGKKKTSNLRLVFDAILKKTHYSKHVRYAHSVRQLMFTCHASQSDASSLFSFVCQEKLEAT